MPRKVVLVAVVLVSALSLAAAGCGGDDDEGGGDAGAAPTTTGDEAGAVTVMLAEQNGSGESGTATLTAEGDTTMVVLDLTGGSSTPQPAHIHSGACPDVGDVVYPLTNVVDGKSETTVQASLDDLLGTDYAINVHESEANAGNYVSCGDLPQG